MNLEEQICRIICKAENVDPDKTGVGLGSIMPKGEEYELWKARIRVAKSLIDELGLTE